MKLSRRVIGYCMRFIRCIFSGSQRMHLEGGWGGGGGGTIWFTLIMRELYNICALIVLNILSDTLQRDNYTDSPLLRYISSGGWSAGSDDTKRSHDWSNLLPRPPLAGCPSMNS